MRYFNNLSEFVAQKTVFCGIDMHLKHWNVCVLCDGGVVEEVRIDGSIIRLLNLLKLYSTAPHVRIVYECGLLRFLGVSPVECARLFLHDHAAEPPAATV